MKTILTTHLLICIVLLPVLGNAQFVTISGFVTDSITGKALQNVTVFESSLNIGTITDHNGFFKLLLTNGSLELEITSSGFQKYTRGFELKNDTTLSVKLTPEIEFKSRQKKQAELHAGAKTPKKFLGSRRFK